MDMHTSTTERRRLDLQSNGLQTLYFYDLQRLGELGQKMTTEILVNFRPRVKRQDGVGQSSSICQFFILFITSIAPEDFLHSSIHHNFDHGFCIDATTFWNRKLDNNLKVSSSNQVFSPTDTLARRLGYCCLLGQFLDWFLLILR